MGTHIKSIIEGFFIKSREKFTVYQRIDKVLDESVDGETRKYISIKEVSESKLILRAQSSSALYNFNLQKERVLAAVKREIGSITDIISKVN
jgi:hypothetical protein